MNVHDHLKNKTVSEIQSYYIDSSIPAAAAMMHILGDFNLGSLIRSANFYGFKETIYIGGKKSFDRRSTVGTHNYIPTIHVKTEDEFINFCLNKYSMICVENNIPEYSHKTISLFDDDVFEKIENPPIFIFGEEQSGISDSILSACDRIITIPHYGSVRSLNVGSCASTIFAFYRKFFNEKQSMGNFELVNKYDYNQ